MKNQFAEITMAATLGLALAFTSCSDNKAITVESGSFTDVRDGRTYKTVKIATLTWMAENLNYNAEGSKCYDNYPSICEAYGRLYDWETAMKACPSGWHLPSKYEWDVLTELVGGEKKEGKLLKATSGWLFNGNGEDKFGFSALPCGYGSSNGSFGGFGDIGYWWTAGEEHNRYAYARYYANADWKHGTSADWTDIDKKFLFSVRCLRDYTKLELEIAMKKAEEEMKKEELTAVKKIPFTDARDSTDKSNLNSARCLQDYAGREIAAKEEQEAAMVKNAEEAWKRIEKISGYFTDARDGKKYRTVKVGEQTWMAENLNHNVGGSKCYDKDPANCEKYGRLYDWKTAMKACPSGWHLPTKEEWDLLYRFAEGPDGPSSPYSNTLGKKLKAANGWYKYGNGTDEFGFSALPGGFLSIDLSALLAGIFDGPPPDSSDGSFRNIGQYSYWWSASELGAYAYSWLIMHNEDYTFWDSNNSKSHLLSVRCLGD